jgi:ethanolamine ammonia-lyase large subunit
MKTAIMIMMIITTIVMVMATISNKTNKPECDHQQLVMLLIVVTAAYSNYIISTTNGGKVLTLQDTGFSMTTKRTNIDQKQYVLMARTWLLLNAAWASQQPPIFAY